MKRTLKKSMSILLAFTLLFGSFAFGFSDVNWSSLAVKAEAESGVWGECGQNLIWIFDEDEKTLTISGSGDMYDYSNKIEPWRSYDADSLIIEPGVTSIGASAFPFAPFQSIVIPNSVNKIGAGAFSSCGSLTNLTIGGNVTSIGAGAFQNCTSLSIVAIPDSVTSIGAGAFQDCTSLSSVAIPDGVTTIESETFRNCTSLTDVIIPDSVTSIGLSAFYGCSKLESIVIPDSVTSIDSFAFYGCSKLASIVIPDGVTTINSGTFRNCTSLTDVIIPDGVTSIDGYAFDGCINLASITLPDSVTSIGFCAFTNTAYYNNTSNWENNVLYISKHLIKANTGLSGVYKIKDDTLTIALDAFENCKDVTSIRIPGSVVSIRRYAFSGCSSLTSISVDSANTVYSSDKFGVLFNKDETQLIYYPLGNTRTSYKIPDSVTSIGEAAFKDCKSLTFIEIPDSVTSIGKYAFDGCEGLTNITIPDSVTSIGGYAFDGCESLTCIIIPDSVTSIGLFAFYYCDKLEYVHIPSSVTEIKEAILNGTVAYICSDTENCYAKTYADENGIEFVVCDGHGIDEPEEPTTKPVEVPSTTKPVEAPTTTKPTVTEPSTTKPIEIPSTTKPIEIPTTTKPTTSSTTKPVETTKSTTEPAKPTTTKPVATTKPVITTNPATTTKTAVEEEFIKKPSTSTVKYGETLILHADFENIPEGAKIEWSVEGNGVTIVPSADGKTCAVTSTSTGDVTITAKYVDSNGVEHVSEQEIKSNASFWQKIVSFFKNLFGINRIIEQVIKF